MIVASIASLSSRKELLKRTVASLRPQVDALCVYLNGYEEVPSFLHHPKVLYAILSSEAGWRGDEAKFWFFDQREFCAPPRWTPDDIALTCDDDIVYPGDYVARMVAALGRHPGALVAVHGSIITEPFTDYASSRMVARTIAPLTADARMHVAGTGTAAFRIGTLPIVLRDVAWSHAVDLHVAALCQRHSIPIWAVARRAHWLMPMAPPKKGTSIARQRGLDATSFESQLAHERRPWEPLPTAGFEDRRPLGRRLPATSAPRTPPPATPAMPRVAELVAPWTATPLPVRPFPGFYGFNPSVHRDRDGTWRCVIRQANYHMPGGVPIVPPGGMVQTRNVVVTLDPVDLSVTHIQEMNELDGLPRPYTQVRGFEDLRLFQTESGAFFAVATAMQLNARGRQEIVLLELDDRFQIVGATPLRGAWSSDHQKNWTPFDGAPAPRLLYSIERGGIHDRSGLVVPGQPPPAPPQPKKTKLRRLKYARQVRTPVPVQGAAPPPPPVTVPLRGGSQLVRIAPGKWLGVGHGMRMLGAFKYYWHTNYLVDDHGRLLARSAPFKFSEHGIEFAAGIAIDAAADRLVYSWGTEDQDAWLGETTLSAVLATLQPIISTSSVGWSMHPDGDNSATRPQEPYA